MKLKQIAGIRGESQQETPEFSTLTDIEITGETSYKKVMIFNYVLQVFTQHLIMKHIKEI